MIKKLIQKCKVKIGDYKNKKKWFYGLYLNELSNIEYSKAIKDGVRYRDLKQPVWCMEHESVSPMGCWSLIANPGSDYRIRLKNDCINCDFSYDNINKDWI